MRLADQIGLLMLVDCHPHLLGIQTDFKHWSLYPLTTYYEYQNGNLLFSNAFFVMLLLCFRRT